MGADLGFGDGDGHAFGLIVRALFIGAEALDEMAVDELAAAPGAGDAKQAGALDQGCFGGGYGGVGGFGGVQAGFGHAREGVDGWGWVAGEPGFDAGVC